MISNTRQLSLVCSHSFVKRFTPLMNFSITSQIIKKRFDVERTGIFDNNGNIRYGLWRNYMFTKLDGPSMRMSGKRLRNAKLFGQNIVFDLSCDYMPPLTCRNFAFQLMSAYKQNRLNSLEPFNLHFCSLNYESKMWQFLSKYLDIDHMSDQHFIISTTKPDISPYKSKRVYHMSDNHFINMTTKSYLDIFPDKSKLVYITPDARQTLHYDHNAVYIIGYHGFNGKTDFISATYGNIQMRRFPIDESEIISGRGSKYLHLQSSLAILNDIKDGYSWSEAFHRNLAYFFKMTARIEKEDQYRINVLRKRAKISENMYIKYVNKS